MAGTTECYVDTSAFIAAMDRSDRHHAVYARLFAAPPRLVTSSLVVAEGHGWLLRRYGRSRAIEFLRFIQALTHLTVLSFGEADLGGVMAMLHKFRDRNITLADTHGLLLMKERRINACWSTDRHLGLTGVPLVL